MQLLKEIKVLELSPTSSLLFGSEMSPFVPTSPGEIFLAFVLALPSITFLLYLVVVFYRCVCTRNYAEWRASWEEGPKQQQDLYTQVSGWDFSTIVAALKSAVDPPKKVLCPKG